MKLLFLLLVFAGCAFTRRLISDDEVISLFEKFGRNAMTSADTRRMDEVMELLQRPSRDSREYSRDSLECLICRSVFAALFAGVRDAVPDDELVEGITILCTQLNIQSYEVCRGVVRLNLPVLTYIIETTPESSPETFCSLIQQGSQSNSVCPLADPRFEWTVELPGPPTVQPSNPVTDNRTLTIALLSDAHIDPLYEANGVADCDAPTCCRKGQTRRVSYTYQYNFDDALLKDSLLEREGKMFLDLDKAEKVREAKMASQTRVIAPRNGAPAGYWGDYRNCDTPIWAFDNVVDEVVTNHRDIDIVYYIGDTIDHHVWETEYEMMTEMNDHLIDKIRSGFGPGVPVIPVIGNHEAQPTNQFAPSSVTVPGINTTWLYESLARKWQYYLPPDALESLGERGAFSLLVRPSLRVISINNNIAYRYNWWLVYDPLEQKRHLEWLVEELRKAESAGEKVHILAHIPPGVNDLTYVWTREYNRVINRFASTITAEFNGHTHSDEFKIFYDSEEEPALVAWGAGSTTAYSNYNMNYKIVTVDGSDFEVENIKNFVYNLTEANLTPHRAPHWFELYNFQHRYRVPNLSPTSIHNLVYTMVTTDKSLLDLYAAFFYKLSDARPLHDNSEWKLNDLCKAVITVLWQRQRCEEIRDLFYLTG